MITTINEFRQYSSGHLVDTNKLFPEDNIYVGNLIIVDEMHDMKITITTVTGNVFIASSTIPKWCKNITVNGDFNAGKGIISVATEGSNILKNKVSWTGSIDLPNLISLVNCPKIINGDCNIVGNLNIDLENGPKVVTGTYVVSTTKSVKYIERYTEVSKNIITQNDNHSVRDSRDRYHKRKERYKFWK